MNLKEKITYVNLLIDTYGSLLTNKQLLILKDKYQYDLSYQEIAENNKITRQAAEDTVKVSIKKLEEYESKLHLIVKKNKILNVIKDKKTKDKIKKII